MENRTIIVTGGSSGLGRGIAIELARKNYRVVIHARRAEELQKTKDDCIAAGSVDEKILVVPGDLRVAADVEHLIQSTIDKYGRIDGLINNAGCLITDGLKGGSLEAFDTMIAMNLRTVYHISMLAVPHLIKSKGSIVNISSGVTVKCSPSLLSYSMCKSAIETFTKITALELGPDKVRVNAVSPAFVPTEDFLDPVKHLSKEEQKAYEDRWTALHPLGRLGTREDIAKAVAYLISDDASWVTGSVLEVGGGFHIPDYKRQSPT